MDKELNQSNKNCGRFNGQPWIKSKCPVDKAALPKAVKQEEITMINTSKPNDLTFRKSASGTVKSITECINSGQLGDLTMGDQTDDSGKETASESSETTGNLTKSSFDLNSSQSSSSYSTENEDCSIKKDCCSSIDKSSYRKECCANKSKSKSHHRKEKCSTNLNEPFYLHHADPKNEKSRNRNLNKLDRVSGKSEGRMGDKVARSDQSVNERNDRNESNERNDLVDETVTEATKPGNASDKVFKQKEGKTNEKPENTPANSAALNKSATFTSKSIRIFEANKPEQQQQQKANKIMRLEEKFDELDQVKLKEHATQTSSSPATPPAESSEESPIDSRIANKDEAKEKSGSQVDECPANRTMAAIPVPPPMPGELPALRPVPAAPVLIKTNKPATEKPALSQTPKITFIPPQFSSPPETDTNLKPSEYLKKVAKSYTVDNFKNMKKVRLAQQRFKGVEEESGDSIKRSSSENHLLVNARKEQLNQSASSNNVRNDLAEDDADSNDPELQHLDDDTEDELAEHQYEISKPSAVELKLQLDKQLINSNLSRRSSIKLKLTALELDEDKEEKKSVQSVSTSSTITSSSTSSGSTSSGSTSSTVTGSFGVTEEQLKTIFLKKTPVKKPETKTFSPSGEF